MKRLLFIGIVFLAACSSGPETACECAELFEKEQDGEEIDAADREKCEEITRHAKPEDYDDCKK